jgi:proteasome beta subunit
MSTIVGLRCRDGVVVAGDRLQVRDGHVKSRDYEHVFDLSADEGEVGAAASGRNVGEFADELEHALRSYRLDRGAVGSDALERLASDVAAETGTEAIVATRDDDGRAGLATVSADGAAHADSPAVFGTGTSLALGVLEDRDVAEQSVSEAETAVREVFEAVSTRAPETGEEVDVWTLVDADGERSDA